MWEARDRQRQRGAYTGAFGSDEHDASVLLLPPRRLSVLTVYRQQGVVRTESHLASPGETSAPTLFCDPSPALRVLLVALETMLAERTRRQLEREGYCVRLTASEIEAIYLARWSWPDLVVLDVSSSGSNDLGTFERLRSQSDVPIVMLSPLADEEDRVHGLNRGADDFLPRPVSPRELAARVTSVLRRSRRLPIDDDRGCVVAGVVTLNQRTREVTIDGRPVALTAMEFKLLRYFVHRPFDALDRATLLEQVWGYTIGDGSTVTVYVRRLREKIESDPAAPSLIRTVWGLGYAFYPTSIDSTSGPSGTA